ncbi:MAG: c-type cytochrome [Pseudomonadales bacterium]
MTRRQRSADSGAEVTRQRCITPGRGIGLALLILGGLLAAPTQADPRTHYLLHCMGCHQPEGAGTPMGIPALRDRVGYYLDLPGGRDYLLHVPGARNAPLTDDDLAAVMNWVIESFGGSSLPTRWEPFTAREGERARSLEPVDIDAWRARLWAQLPAH